MLSAAIRPGEVGKVSWDDRGLRDPAALNCARNDELWRRNAVLSVEGMVERDGGMCAVVRQRDDRCEWDMISTRVQYELE